MAFSLQNRMFYRENVWLTLTKPKKCSLAGNRSDPMSFSSCEALAPFKTKSNMLMERPTLRLFWCSILTMIANLNSQRYSKIKQSSSSGSLTSVESSPTLLVCFLKLVTLHSFPLLQSKKQRVLPAERWAQLVLLLYKMLFPKIRFRIPETSFQVPRKHAKIMRPHSFMATFLILYWFQIALSKVFTTSKPEKMNWYTANKVRCQHLNLDYLI